VHSAFASGLNLIFALAGTLAIVVAVLALFLMRPVKPVAVSAPVGSAVSGA
jgi:hypothetical protein